MCVRPFWAVCHQIPKADTHAERRRPSLHTHPLQRHAARVRPSLLSMLCTKVLLPPGDDIEWASDAAIANAFADWVPSASLPTILNYADIERSLTQGFASGTPVMPNASAYPFHSGNKTQIVVRGINNPIHCTQLGNWTLKVVSPALSSLSAWFLQKWARALETAEGGHPTTVVGLPAL